MPTAIIRMEAAYTAHRFQLDPEVSHRYREGNVWADALANGDIQGFNPEHRYAPLLNEDFFFVRGPLLKAWQRASGESK